MNMCKIGLTTKEDPLKRINEGKTYNPFLELFATYQLSACTWGCSQQELNDIENYFHHRATFGGAIKHVRTQRDSEWFFNDPEEAEHQIDWMLAKRGFSVRGWSLYEIYIREDRDQEKLNYVNVDALKEIKTIFRPEPYEYKSRALAAGLRDYQFADYFNFLFDFHRG
ncbi:TPA: GIY-YIG nuclease family protein [Citrobacter braakii]|nr:GIY-YIG nuclease family protein [Citrobacter braakii]